MAGSSSSASYRWGGGTGRALSSVCWRTHEPRHAGPRHDGCRRPRERPHRRELHALAGAALTFIILLATLSTLIPYAFCSLAGFMLAGQSPAMRMTRGAVGIASLAFAYSVYAIAGAGAEVVFSGFILLICGLRVYVWVARRGDFAPSQDPTRGFHL